MDCLTKAEILERLKRYASNSNHFVWLLDDLCFLETHNQWVFGYKVIDRITFFAVEPLIPSEAGKIEAFDTAWAEFRSVVQPEIAVFVAVGKAFFDVLRQKGFLGMQIGLEPWIDLAQCIPKGNSGKGVRSARNQAIKSQVKVEEWLPENTRMQEELAEEMQAIYKDWGNRRIVQLSGFILSTDSFAFMQERRYFLAKSLGKLQGYLIASPIYRTESFYIEDLIIRGNAPRGTGELLTLEAMVALRDSGYREASLGIVSVNSMEKVHFFIDIILRVLKKFYNFNGMELYRKRFNPHRWSPVYLAIANYENGNSIPILFWLRMVIAFVKLFKFRIRLSPKVILQSALKRISKTPITVMYLFVTLILFLLANRGGDLNPSVFARFGFYAAAPIREWLLRSVTSDFLYLDRVHFVMTALPLFLLIYWTEKSHQFKFTLTVLVLTHVFDDIIDYFLIYLPFSYVQPALFARLISEKDVGGSLTLATLLGIQICQIRKHREIIFVALILSVVLVLALTSIKYHIFIINLNHLVFLGLGFTVGKLKFEFQRMQSRKASRNKPPEAKSVNSPRGKNAA